MATLDAFRRSQPTTSARKRSLENTWGKIKRGWQLYLMLLIPLAWLLVFQYWPMYGAQIAFRNYLPGTGIWESPWVGLDNFIKFFNSYMFWRVLRNTLWISFYSLLVGFPIPIIFALAINQLPGGWFKRTIQMVSYAPYFISTVVVVGMVIQFLDLRRCPINLLLQALGMSPINFMGSPEYGVMIIEAMETNQPARVNGNVPNTGVITNLPSGCTVEVPCLVDSTGVRPVVIGDLPIQLAALNRTNINVQELTVEAALSGKKDAVYHAVMLDPLTAGVCTLPQIHAMVSELLAAQNQWLPQFEF